MFHIHCLGISVEEYNDDNFLAHFICPICQGEVDGPEDVLKGYVLKLQTQGVDKQKKLA